LNTFLSTVARDLLDSFGSDLSRVLLLFPNRRSASVFHDELSRLIKQALWSPESFSINDWIRSLSSFDLANELDQSIQLYLILKNNWSKIGSYNEFSSWGDMLIRDFEELDKYLLDPEEVYSFLSDEKEIEARFSTLESDEIRHLQNFWSSIRDNPSLLQQDWLGLWNVLGLSHSEYVSALAEKGLASEGCMYRDAVKQMQDQNSEFLQGRILVFIGFNALTQAEELIFQEAKLQHRGRYYWDCPPYLLQEENITGKLIRYYLKKFEQASSFQLLLDSSANRLDHRRNTEFSPMEIFSFDSSIAQTKIISSWLQNWSEDSGSESKNIKTGIILGEEDLFEEIMLAWNPGLNNLNSSIGYSINHCEVVRFLELYGKLVVLLKTNSQLNIVNSEIALMFIENPCFSIYSDIDSEVIDDLLNCFKRREHIPVKKLDSLLPFIKFSDSSLSSSGLLETLISLLKRIRIKFEELNFKNISLEKAGINQMMDFFELTRNSLNRMPDALTPNDLLTYIEGWIKQQRIPYESERTAPVQLTGILETRLIDYNDLIILSCNEGVWPSAQSKASFIPYHIRMKYGLPVKENHDAIYGYHFYRLIQRAERVRIAYVGTADGIRTGLSGKSRFIYQTEFDADVDLNYSAVRSAIKLRPISAFSIEKTDKIWESLMKYTKVGEKQGLLSPSALNTYIDCPLKFAHQYLLGLRDSEIENALSDPRIFGTVLHTSMEIIYKEHLNGQAVSRLFCESLFNDTDKLKSIIRQAAVSVLSSDGTNNIEVLGAKDELVLDVILNYLKLILISDASYAPFTIIGIESKVKTSWRMQIDDREFELLLGGFIDRVDSKDGVIRIVDYKSGKPEMRFKDWNDLIDSSKQKRPKEILQALIYCCVYHLNSKDDYSIKPVLYAMRGLEDGKLNADLKHGKNVIDHQELYFQAVQELIDQVLSDMFDSSRPFVGTTNSDTCKYCNFNDLCQKEEGY
jgi:hypothetical protein